MRLVYMREIKYFEAIREALDQSMAEDDSIIVVGEGVPDPKGIFGTTLGLASKYGKKRVLDMPLSENGMTGICIGAALTGLRPVLVHQRVDFSLLSMDQIVNNAAKWHYMFGGQSSVPLVIRMIVGMGWGQGAQHAQSLQALFAHIPGLKVVMPATAYDAKGLLISSIRDNNPIIFMEHRWLHNISGYVPQESYTIPLGKAKVMRQGVDISVVVTSYMAIEAIRAADYLQEKGINVEIVDVRTIKPLDDQLILESVKKTRRLLVIDQGHCFGGFAGEIISRVSESAYGSLSHQPQRITLPDIPAPSSSGLAKYFYPRYPDIIRKILTMLGKDTKDVPPLEDSIPLDVPYKSFTGPF